MIINIGTNAETGKPVTLNLQALISSHLMLEGNTNAGKSYTVRVIAEQVFGLMPHILIDPEGEYTSLRKKYGYLLVGEGGEVQLRNETAPKLAETLIEGGFYAIINL
jgi:Helicase HerA, central domain